MTVSATPSTPLDILWQAPAITAVVLVGEGLAMVLALSPGVVGDRWVFFGLASLMIQWVVLLTLGGLFLLRRALARSTPQAIARVALGLLLLSTWAAGAAAWWLLHDQGPAGTDGPIELLLRLTAMALTIGLLALGAFQSHWRTRRLAVQTKQAELEALQARIRPHFLFNTLNTGAALVHARPGEAERLLLDLADLFRAALSGPREIPLGDELALARRYLEIEALRFGPRLRLLWELPAALPAVTVPTLSIQPLVENAIRHGVEPSANGGTIEVSVRVEPDAVRILVRNDLPPPGARPAPGHQVGLASARERIGALSGGRGRLETRVEAGRYVAEITLPTGAG